MPIHVPASPPYDAIGESSAVRVVDHPQTILDDYPSYLRDESRLTGNAERLVFASSEHHIVSLLKEASNDRTQVTISAGRTGVVGGGVPQGGILLSMERMDRFRGVRWDEDQNRWILNGEPGITIRDLQDQLDRSAFQDITIRHPEIEETFRTFAAESSLWFYPPDPTEKTAHLGGTVATDASGTRSLKYGRTRNYICSLRVILSDGTVLDIPRGQYVDKRREGFRIEGLSGIHFIPPPPFRSPDVKSSTGYFASHPQDLIDFFIGSEGTLGVITEIGIALERKPEYSLTAIAFFPDEEHAFLFVESVQERRKKQILDPTALEYFDGKALQILQMKKQEEGARSKIPNLPKGVHAAVFFEQEGKREGVDSICIEYADMIEQCGGKDEMTWVGMSLEEKKHIQELRHMVPEEINHILVERQRRYPGFHKISTDFAVPEATFRRMVMTCRASLAEEGLEHVLFGHIGEHHLHMNILPRNEEEFKRAKDVVMSLARQAVLLGGSVSAEHGIGKIKRDLLEIQFDAESISAMRRLKEAFDPAGILGQGVFWE